MTMASDATLSADEQRDLATISGIMIPASAEFAVPGADDPAIQSDIVKSMGRDRPLVRTALQEIAIATVDPPMRATVINGYCGSAEAAAAALRRVILSAYYRDDRVLLALGLEARAPFPKGYEIEQGDWSLLDAVRKREPFWRDDRTGGKGRWHGRQG